MRTQTFRSSVFAASISRSARSHMHSHAGAWERDKHGFPVPSSRFSAHFRRNPCRSLCLAKRAVQRLGVVNRGCCVGKPLRDMGWPGNGGFGSWDGRKMDRHVFARTSLRLHQSHFLLGVLANKCQPGDWRFRMWYAGVEYGRESGLNNTKPTVCVISGEPSGALRVRSDR